MKKLLLIFLLSNFILGGCAIRVNTSYDKKADFSQYKTFCWLKGCEFTFTGPAYLNDEVVRGNLKKAIVKEMENKGFVYNDDTPDLLVDFHVTVENRSTAVYRFEEERFEQISPGDQPDVYYFLEGTVIIDMVDQPTGQMVWRCSANQYLELNPDLSEANLNKAIRIVLKDFPPK